MVPALLSALLGALLLWGVVGTLFLLTAHRPAPSYQIEDVLPHLRPGTP